MKALYKLEFEEEIISFKKIAKLYEKIYNNIDRDINKFTINGIDFNNFKGDITKNINWTWIINDLGLKFFSEFMIEIELLNNLKLIYNNEFHIIGISFITVNTQEIKETDTDFHYDILSQCDISNKTNILTVLIPLKIEEGMGGLEYYLDSEIHNCKYKIGEYYTFDSSKLKHRTEPFKLDIKKKRVLISINLSSSQSWAVEDAKRSTYYQGNYLSK